MQALTKAGKPFTLHEYTHHGTAPGFGEEAAQALGVDPARMFKTLIVDAGGRLAVGVVPVAGMLDLKAMAAAVDAKSARLAESAAAERATGYVVGGISPLGQRKRLVTAAEPGEPGPVRALAQAIGVEPARDRLLLRSADPAEGLALLEGWTPPRLPIGGGDLVALGLNAGPLVAATLQAIERQWVEEDFPNAARVRAIAGEKAVQALRAR